MIGALTRLKQEPGQDILLSASSKLLNSLLPHELVDEVRLMLHPFVLGKGKRLFDEGAPLTAMDLTQVQKFASGITVLHYHPRPAAAPARQGRQAS